MEFKQSVKEALTYYVYALVDPETIKFSILARVKTIAYFNMLQLLLMK